MRCQVLRTDLYLLRDADAEQSSDPASPYGQADQGATVARATWYQCDGAQVVMLVPQPEGEITRVPLTGDCCDV